MQYAFPCNIVPDAYADGSKGFMVKFPDVHGAHTGGRTFKKAILMAEDCLVVALAAYIDGQEELPTPSPRAAGQELIGVQPLIAAQLDLYTALRAQGMGTADLARHLGVSEKEAGQLLILNYSAPIDRVMAALAAVGAQPAAERAA